MTLNKNRLILFEFSDYMKMVKYERLLFCIECHDRGDRIKAKEGYLTNENDEIICKKHKLL